MDCVAVATAADPQQGQRELGYDVLVENNKHAASSAKYIADYLQDRYLPCMSGAALRRRLCSIVVEDGFLRSLDKIAKPPKNLLSGCAAAIILLPPVHFCGRAGRWCRARRCCRAWRWTRR